MTAGIDTTTGITRTEMLGVYQCGSARATVERVKGRNKWGTKWSHIIAEVECDEFGEESTLCRWWEDEWQPGTDQHAEDIATDWAVTLIRALGEWAYSNYGGELPKLQEREG